MPKLHLIATSLCARQLNQSIKRYSTAGDSLLFIGDAVSLLLKQTSLESLSGNSLKLYALAVDCRCRAIEKLIHADVSQISDAQMVELTLTNQQVISW